MSSNVFKQLCSRVPGPSQRFLSEWNCCIITLAPFSAQGCARRRRWIWSPDLLQPHSKQETVSLVSSVISILLRCFFWSGITSFRTFTRLNVLSHNFMIVAKELRRNLSLPSLLTTWKPSQLMLQRSHLHWSLMFLWGIHLRQLYPKNVRHTKRFTRMMRVRRLSWESQDQDLCQGRPW